jgi:hypothetical protein
MFDMTAAEEAAQHAELAAAGDPCALTPPTELDVDGGGGCPDCGHPELNADSEPEEDGVYDVWCPSCRWHGVANEFTVEGAITDLAC